MENKIEEAMEEAFRNHFLGGSKIGLKEARVFDETVHRDETKMHLAIQKNKVFRAVRTMSKSEYWNRANTIEAWGFATKIAIIFPGLLFGRQFWWLYVFAIASSVALIWSSTVKTLPTIILFNVAWVVLASAAIIKHFVS